MLQLRGTCKVCVTGPAARGFNQTLGDNSLRSPLTLRDKATSTYEFACAALRTPLRLMLPQRHPQPLSKQLTWRQEQLQMRDGH